MHKVAAGRRLRPCLVCARPSLGNYCPEHEPTVDEAERNARNPYRQAYKDPAYAKHRQHAFERQRGRCGKCGVELQPGLWQADHIVPLSKGGSNDVTNLLCVCIPCHKAKTRQDRNTPKG